MGLMAAQPTAWADDTSAVQAPSAPSHPIIHAITDDTPLGEYTQARAAADFAPGIIRNGHWSYSDTAHIVTDPYGPGRALRITHPIQPSLSAGELANKVLNGKVLLPRNYDQLVLEYEVAFGDGFLFESPLGPRRAYGGKLPGLAGGATSVYAPVSCQAADASKGFSVRQMWRHPSNSQAKNGVQSPLMAYVYWHDKENRCGDDYGYSLTGPRLLRDNRYYKITQKVTVNAVGRSDGRVETWIDDRKVLDQPGFLFRSVDTFSINQLIFHSYFGGATSEWGHPRVETQYYRNIRVFTVPAVEGGGPYETANRDVGGTVPAIDEGCPPSRVPDVRFADVSPSSSHMRAIGCIVQWHVTRGVSYGSYEPSRDVSRGQMATFMARVIAASDAPLPEPKRQPFKDIEGSPHAANINALASIGVVEGKSVSRYEADRIVSRAQMATFLLRTYEYIRGAEYTAAGNYFTDDDGTTHEANINAAAAAGFANGTSALSYGPAADVRRDQMASFIARLLNRLVVEGHA